MALYLKDNVKLEELLNYGFIEDPANFGNPQDHYYFLNNWFCERDSFRIIINSNNRMVEILCLPKECELQQLSYLEPLYELMVDNMLIDRNR